MSGKFTPAAWTSITLESGAREFGVRTVFPDQCVTVWAEFVYSPSLHNVAFPRWCLCTGIRRYPQYSARGLLNGPPMGQAG